MTKANHLVRLFKAGAKGNVRDFQHVAENIIAEEKQKKHNILADRLSEIMKEANPLSMNGRSLDSSVPDYITEISPERRLESLVLSDDTLALIEELIEEHHRTDLLKSFGLLPRHKVMLLGPPGNGKTAFAESVAYELMVPLLVANYDAIIGKFLGETSSRLKKVFEYARQTKCVLFFDEFDAIGKERADVHETGEIKRVVSALLTQIDLLPSYTTVIVASNHPDILDSAVWRRFQVRINMPSPTRTQKEKFIKNYEDKIGLNFGRSVANIAKELKADSYAEVEEFCRDVLRRATLDNHREDAKDITTAKLKQWNNRYLVKGKQNA